MFNRLFDDSLYFIPISGVNPDDFGVEILLNFHKHSPFFPVGDKRNRYTNTPKTTGTTNTMKVGLAIGLACGRFWIMELWNILDRRASISLICSGAIYGETYIVDNHGHGGNINSSS